MFLSLTLKCLVLQAAIQVNLAYDTNCNGKICAQMKVTHEWPCGTVEYRKLAGSSSVIYIHFDILYLCQTTCSFEVHNVSDCEIFPSQVGGQKEGRRGSKKVQNRRNLNVGVTLSRNLVPFKMNCSHRFNAINNLSFKSSSCEKCPEYTLMLILLNCACSILLVLVIWLAIYARKKEKQLIQSSEKVNLQTLMPRTHKKLKLKRENLKLNYELGVGSFGVVYKGQLRTLNGKATRDLDVAVKTTNDDASLDDFVVLLNEANIMENLNAKHVVKLLGIVSDDQKYFLVMEFMENHDLKSFLTKIKFFETGTSSFNRISFPRVAHMAIQIADGMAYLVHKKVVHRDLAARNCMVSADQTVKIGDFGTARDINRNDYYRMDLIRLLPVRWMAPESFNNKFFTSESDIFSYGIVLFEIVTFADQPYKQLSDEEVIEHICAGKTETRPQLNCSDKIHDLMTKCWKFNPQERITFTEIVQELLDEAPENFAEDSFHSLKRDAFRIRIK